MTLCIQAYTGDGKNPDPNDASVEWDGPKYPVADIELPRQGAHGKELSELITTMAFNPANGFSPTAMTRAREHIYAESAKNRGAISAQEARLGLRKLGVQIP